MKTKVCLSFVCLVGLIITSCTDMLNVQPKSSLPTDGFYKTQKDVISAINDVYGAISADIYNQTELVLGENLSDHARTEDFSDIPTVALVNYTYDASNSWVEAYWSEHYRVINKANNIIKKVPEVKMDANLKERIIGEARFLRALSYFNLVKAFGGVPLVLKPTTGIKGLEVVRSPKDEVYQQIFADLNEAKKVLPGSYGSSDTGRATKWAAIALLSRAYLYHEDWEQAAKTAKEVMDSNNFELFEDYANKWKIKNENGKEFIFSIQKDVAINQMLITAFTMPRNTEIGPVNWGGVIPTIQFYNSYADLDYRKQVAYRTSFTLSSGEVLHFSPHCWKYYTEGEIGRSGVNYPVIGYDEILLNYAEAVNEAVGPVQKAYDAINKIRNRAHLPDLPSGLTQDEFRKAVWQERSWELAFEGHRTWDLMRTGQLVQALRAAGVQNVSDKHQRLPIPQREIDINSKLEQNPGW